MRRIMTCTNFTSAARIARQLEWRKGSVVLCVLMDRHRGIDVSLGRHPSSPAEPLVSLGSSSSLEDTLENAAAAQDCAGVLVGWPVQPEGWCGAACGKVLHTLDRLPKNDTTMNIPMALYTPPPQQPQPVYPKDDGWGRNPLYSRTTTKQCHVASQEQYQRHALSDSSAQLYAAFCRDYWPATTTMPRKTYPHPPLPPPPHALLKTRSLVRA